jgi:Bacterial regulatory proteins, lacI family
VARDVAIRAGVSSTVSRVFNGTASVRPDKYEAVIKAAQDLGFVANGAAGSVANFLGGHATPMDMTGFIPPTNRIAEPDTPRLSSATGLSESYA